MSILRNRTQTLNTALARGPRPVRGRRRAEALARPRHRRSGDQGERRRCDLCEAGCGPSSRSAGGDDPPATAAARPDRGISRSRARLARPARLTDCPLPGAAHGGDPARRAGCPGTPSPRGRGRPG